MNFSEAVKFHEKPAFHNAVLIVGWLEDASSLAKWTADYLVTNLKCGELGEIDPERFFPMTGVSVENNVAQFPECKFYGCGLKDLVIFLSNIPRIEWYRFLNVLLQAARECDVREIYTLGAMISASAHTMPRQLIGIRNTEASKADLEPFSVLTSSDYETVPGQKPTMSSYLLWLARQQGIKAVNLWVPIPYYLLPINDPRACKRLIYFFNSKFDLGIDFRELDAEIAEQNRRISDLYAKSPHVEELVRKLEVGRGLDSDESEKLAKEMLQYLRK
ncbi:MAG: PAC2 family protein [Dehalococcoidia bacterium]|nr:PAC2 family protein [Dehalococcoidia bacterium]